METLDVFGSQPQLSHPGTEAAVRILLLDCDDRRRALRVEALLNRGVLVDQATESMTATTLWKPGAYDLVLVELRGADAGCTAFISSVQGKCSRQKFGFHIGQRPYLTVSAEQGRRWLQNHFGRNVREGLAPDSACHHGNRLFVVSTRIGTARQVARLQARAQQFPRMPEVREGNPGKISTSDAVTLARQVLGGATKP